MRGNPKKYDYDSMTEQEKEYSIHLQLKQKEVEIDRFVRSNFLMYACVGAVIFMVFYSILVVMGRMCSKKKKRPVDFLRVIQDKKELKKSWRLLRKRKLENGEIEQYMQQG